MPDNLFDIKGWLNYLLESLKNIISAVFEDIWEIVLDLVLSLFNSVLDIADWVVTTVSGLFPDLFSTPFYWAGLSNDLLNLAGYVGIDVALGLIITALTLRLILNFIPFN